MPRGREIVDLSPPVRGARSDVAPHLLPRDAVPADTASNVVIRDGFLVNRPGFTAITAATVTGRPTGGFLFKTGASTFTVIGTTSNLYKLDAAGSGWDDLTGPTVPTGSESDPWRFAVFPESAADHLLAVNRTNVMQEWNGVAGTFSNTAGTPPIAGDITTAANRVVVVDTLEAGIRYVYRVRWSDFNTRAVWGVNSFADLSDTPDVMVGCRALSRIAFALYKETSQWVGLAQSGLVPFRFELQDTKPGPVGPAAIVAAEGRHYYLAVDGSVYTFDGIRTTHVGEPIRRFVLKNMNFDQRRRCFGVYLRRDRSIYWIFPAPGADDPTRAVSLHIDTGQFWPHVLQRGVSCGFDGVFVPTVTWDSLTGTWDTIAATYPTWDAFGSAANPTEILGGVGGTVYRFGLSADDDGLAPAAQWRFQNLRPTEAGKRLRVQSCDTFFKKAATPLTVSLKIGTTDSLFDDPTFPAELTDTFDITVSPTAPPSGSGAYQARYDTDSAGAGTGLPEARFISVDHTVTTNQDWSWGGAVLRGYEFETT